MNEKQKNMKEKQAKNFNETLVGQFCWWRPEDRHQRN
jgi:hypothetical protein